MRSLMPRRYRRRMASATIYARVPEQTKDAAVEFAAQHGLTLTSALHDLLALGLESAAGSTTVTALQAEVGQLQEQVRQLEATVQTQALAHARLQHELAALRQAADVWVQRADLPVGTCPSCDHPLSGADVLITGHCSQCQTSTSALVEPKESTLDSRDFMLALGAVGVMLGLVALAAKQK